MKKNKINKSAKRSIFWLSNAVLIMLFTGAVVIFQQSARTASLEAETAAVHVTLSGSIERNAEILTLEKAGMVRPGEIINWQITSENTGVRAAHDYKVVGQIPTGTSFIAGSAKAVAGTTVLYSIDRGKTFSEQPQIEQRQSDGALKKVPAPVSMYTQIRFDAADPISAGGKLNAFYQVRLK